MGKPVEDAPRSTCPGRPRSFSGTPRPRTSSTTRSRRPAPTTWRSSPASRSAWSARWCPGTSRSISPRGRSRRRSLPATASCSSLPSSRRSRRSGSASSAPRRGCPTACSTSSPASARRPGGRSACTRSRLRRLHRLDRGRQALPALLVGVEREAGLARVRRQEPEPGLRRLRGPRPGGRDGRVRDLLQPGRGLLGQLAAAGRALDHATRCVERLLERARAVRVGDPLDPETTMGPLVDERARRPGDGLHRGRARGRASSASAARGSRSTARRLLRRADGLRRDRQRRPASPRRRSSGRCSRCSTFDDEDEALRIANATRYGLAASIWTSNLSRAHRLARRLRAGTVSVNTVDALSPQTPFGGFKRSGFGRDLSLHALDKYTGLKTTWIKL